MEKQAATSAAFRALHERPGAFLIPNPWDVGSARLLERRGFEALATSSAGAAFAVGRPDNQIGRADMLRHSAELVAATNLPVSGDLENGYGDDPETVAETIRLAGATGLAGGSIEDSRPNADDPIYSRELAIERIQAAAEAAKSLAIPFTLTGRAENYLFGRCDIADTVARLQAYQEAGADVLYAPGLYTREDIATVVASVDRPVNVLAIGGKSQLGLRELEELGVKRVSVGSGLARAAYGALLKAAEEMRTVGTVDFLNDAVPFAEINEMFASQET